MARSRCCPYFFPAKLDSNAHLADSHEKKRVGSLLSQTRRNNSYRHVSWNVVTHRTSLNELSKEDHPILPRYDHVTERSRVALYGEFIVIGVEKIAECFEGARAIGGIALFVDGGFSTVDDFDIFKSGTE